MSARDELFLWIDDSLSTEMASQLIDAYAHELAEQIRKEAVEYDGWPDHVNSMNIAANLIDPEVEN